MGEGVPCPVAFEPEELSAKLQVVDANFEGCRGMVGFETETWVSNKYYTMAMALTELLKLRVLAEISEQEVRAKGLHVMNRSKYSSVVILFSIHV